MPVQTNKETLKEYGRGIIGGLLFSLPLIYTMEVWWSGFNAPPEYLLSCVVVTYLLLLGYNRYAGMKKDSSFREICFESVEELALAVIVSFLFLLLLSRIDFGMSWDEIIGKVIVESMIVAIGISVGTAQLGGDEEDSEESDSDQESQSGVESGAGPETRDVSKSKGKLASGKETDKEKNNDSANFKRVVLSICGSVLFASSVAPTEEILMIAVGVNDVELLLMVIISLILGGIIIYFSEFRGSPKERPGVFKMLLDLAVMYCIALIVSFAFLSFFGRVQDYGLEIVIAQLVVLGIPAALGASAGRFLIAG